MHKEEIEIFYPENIQEWRTWLEQYHLLKKSVWVVFYKKNAKKASITWSESVDVALCFGWIDSKKIKIDEEKSHQFFSKRKAISTWSKINKLKVEQLIANGLMHDEGFKSIDTAKQNGSWTILDDVEALVVPTDLNEALKSSPQAKDFFDQLSNSNKKAMLQWLVLARRVETRQQRINEIVTLAAQKLKPKHIP
ncbi:MAG: YdeI/OmpD-associated family protein [Bacteroidetes bacterium]|jgi:uncharacterized protein YdeI (YjbR/CyaY-like superfamily)|nr:YdeI/OmpD-associated family protein [Bacteroidota bacterium]MBK6819660.1 YdeI/OmpD-associated family protein [Bacteroidota bacterium]MBK7039514.1 YdeI/OmpD-associated family protein [Bacteroidota bacterium]MBK9301525.1 YdeI/OmpD-associated family protein [Bacteroidota bacterium]